MLKADLDDSVSELGTVCDVSQYRIYLFKNIQTNLYTIIPRNTILNLII
jgi:hypothetical protein